MQQHGHLVGLRVPDHTRLFSDVGYGGILREHVEERPLLLQLVGSLEQLHGGVVIGAKDGSHPILDERLFEQVRLIGIEADQWLEQGPHQLAGGAHHQQRGNTGGQHQAQAGRLEQRHDTHWDNIQITI